jgi:hypothetical protein
MQAMRAAACSPSSRVDALHGREAPRRGAHGHVRGASYPTPIDLMDPPSRPASDQRGFQWVADGGEANHGGASSAGCFEGSAFGLPFEDAVYGLADPACTRRHAHHGPRPCGER